MTNGSSHPYLSVQVEEVFRVVEEMKSDGVIEDYAVAGAVGAVFYVEPFRTEDIDFLVVLPDSGLDWLKPIRDWLASKGYTQFDSGGHILIHDWPAQFLPVADELLTEAFNQARYIPVDDSLRVRVVRPEYLAAEAVRLSRPKDVQRIFELLKAKDFDLRLFNEVVRRFELGAKWKRLQPFLNASA